MMNFTIRNLISFFAGTLFAFNGNAQPFSVPGKAEPEFITDTIYHPACRGIQLIEVDHIGRWNRYIFYLEQSEPRAMPHSMFHPEPPGNEYYFSDSTGKIIKAYNTTLSADSLTRIFSRKKNRKDTPFGGHAGTIWPYDTSPQFSFGGYYKIFEPDTANPGKLTSTTWWNSIANMPKPMPSYRFGLIDSIGNIVVPCQYQALAPLGKFELAQKNNHWGVIDKSNRVVVDFLFDRYGPYYLDQSSVLISFLIEQKYKLIFNTQTGKSIPLGDYDRLGDIRYIRENKCCIFWKDNKIGVLDSSFHEIFPAVFDAVNATFSSGFAQMRKDGKYGMLDSTGHIFLPAIYDGIDINFSDDLLWICKQGKFGYVDKSGKQRIDLKYDQAAPFYSGVAIVRSENQVIMIDKKEKILLRDSAITAMYYWKEDYYFVNKGKLQGLYNSKGKMILPCIYDGIYADLDSDKRQFIVKENGVEKRISMPDKQ